MYCVNIPNHPINYQLAHPMPQIRSPFFPSDITNITPRLAFACDNGCVTYFAAGIPVFTHAETDRASFLMISAQFYANGHAKLREIASVFGLATITLKRAVKRLREHGTAGFFATPPRRGPAVLTPLVLKEAQRLLDEGHKPAMVAKQLGIKRDTFDKALRANRLRVLPRTPMLPAPVSATHGLINPPLPDVLMGPRNTVATTLSARSEQDAAAPLGMGACNTEGRLAASRGQLVAVAPHFEPMLDVPNAGVLCALPALLALGLLDTAEPFFTLPDGYYGLDSVLLLLAMMALTRQKSVESLRYRAPGEWGNLLGLDRIPEVRTLREKLHLLANEGHPEEWSGELCRQWMQATPALAVTVYVDGHVRVYHGSQTQLPRHYVARQKLCLHATTDYWVNDCEGQPFCVVHTEVDPGLIQVLEGEILPCLEKDVPGQPDAQALMDDPLLHRFRVVFDREGYSPALLKRLKEKRIACITYHKHPQEAWPVEEFQPYTVTLVSGEQVTMQLAERGTLLPQQLWVRELRKCNDNGHQTSIITTDYRSPLAPVAAAMFARWSQENFFRYARQHYHLDRLADYSVAPLSDATTMVNPAYRRLNAQIRSLTGKLNRLQVRSASIQQGEGLTPKVIERFQRCKGELQEQIESIQGEMIALKEQRKQVPPRIQAKDLPPDERFQQLNTSGKHLIDTVKMIAYRAETAMTNLLRPYLARPEESRLLVSSLYQTTADLIPDQKAETLTVSLHHSGNARNDGLIARLCEVLNETRTTFPRSVLRLIFKLGSG